MGNNFMERQTLGCFIQDNDLLKETNLSPEHFQDSIYRRIFEGMLKLSKQGKKIDPVLLMSELYEDFKELGGMAYFQTLKTEGNVDNFEDYEAALIEEYRESEINRILRRYLESEEKDANELSGKIDKVLESGLKEERPLMDVLAGLMERVYEEKTTPSGVKVNLRDFDDMTGGWQPQTFNVIGARPSMGKTAVMLTMAMGAEKNGDVPTIFSLEMSKELLMQRMAANIANINLYFVKNPEYMTSEQKADLYNAYAVLSEMNIEIFDYSLKTVQEIRGDIRRTMKKYPGKRLLVMIDYLTLVKNPGNFNTDHARVSDLSQKLKGIAKEMNVPVVALAQLNRGVEQRQEKRPNMSDLRESGGIEESADLIGFLYRDDYYYADSEKQNILEIDIAKHRDGPTGKIEVAFMRHVGKIVNLDRRSDVG